jgi:hypothetical protein
VDVPTCVRVVKVVVTFSEMAGVTVSMAKILLVVLRTVKLSPLNTKSVGDVNVSAPSKPITAFVVLLDRIRDDPSESATVIVGLTNTNPPDSYFSVPDRTPEPVPQLITSAVVDAMFVPETIWRPTLR